MNTVAALGPSVVALSRIEQDGSQTDLVIVLSKILYRRRIGDLVLADSGRLPLKRIFDISSVIDSIRPLPALAPQNGNVTIVINRGTVVRHRFPADDVPADLVPLVTALTALEKKMPVMR